MEIDDTTRIQTPEGVQLEVTLAGAGSRLAAQAIDSLIKFAAFITFGVFGGLSFGSAGVSIAWTILAFASFFLYETLFESLWTGYTPGKRAMGIRVVSADGGRLTFVSSTVRNLLRIVDFIPLLYVTGFLFVLFTAKNQRIGDLAANALVVRDSRRTGVAAPIRADAAMLPPGFDVTAVTDQHLATARAFVDRRHDLAGGARSRLASTVASGLRDVVGPSAAAMSDEALIEAVVVAKTRRS